MVRIHQSAPIDLSIVKILMIENFLKYCSDKKYQKNEEQIKILKLLNKFYNQNSNSLFNRIILKKTNKLAFYLHGSVGVGKTMLLNFFFENLHTAKLKVHFNDFMIDFHDFRYQNKNKDNSIEKFVKNLKHKVNLIYLDEFQVTNIVDAMILGRLFKTIFKENIKILLSSNVRIKDLYKEGLQREQFVPFVDMITKFSDEHELKVNQDYRKLGVSNLERFFHPINDTSSFQVNSIFREISKGKINTPKNIIIKGRNFIIKNYFEGSARFNFNDLCNEPIGSEDYIKIAEQCNFILIDNVPNFHDGNADKQNRFITLIDVLYEKKIPIMITANFNYKNFTSSRALNDTYKRTISRLFEITSPNFKLN